MPLITRTGKGSKLTIPEMDGNLIYLENLALTSSGSQGITGPTGPFRLPGSIRNDIFTGSIITINHNYGYYPVVQLINSDGELVVPDNLTHSSVNSYTIDFGSTVSGTLITGVSDGLRFTGGGTAISFGSSNINAWGNIIPTSNDTYNLGSSESRWNNLYVKDIFAASQSLYLGTVKLSDNNGELIIEKAVEDGTPTISLDVLESSSLASNDSLVYTTAGETIFEINDVEPILEKGQFWVGINEVDIDGKPKELIFVFPNSDTRGDKVSFWERYVNAEIFETEIESPKSKRYFNTVSVISNSSQLLKNRKLKINKLSGWGTNEKGAELFFETVAKTPNGDGYVIFVPITGPNDGTDFLSCILWIISGEYPFFLMCLSELYYEEIGFIINETINPNNQTEKSPCPTCEKSKITSEKSLVVGDCETSANCPKGYVCVQGKCVPKILETGAKYSISILEETNTNSVESLSSTLNNTITYLGPPTEPTFGLNDFFGLTGGPESNNRMFPQLDRSLGYDSKIGRYMEATFLRLGNTASGFTSSTFSSNKVNYNQITTNQNNFYFNSYYGNESMYELWFGPGSTPLNKLKELIRLGYRIIMNIRLPELNGTEPYLTNLEHYQADFYPNGFSRLKLHGNSSNYIPGNVLSTFSGNTLFDYKGIKIFSPGSKFELSFNEISCGNFTTTSTAEDNFWKPLITSTTTDYELTIQSKFSNYFSPWWGNNTWKFRIPRNTQVRRNFKTNARTLNGINSPVYEYVLSEAYVLSSPQTPTYFSNFTHLMPIDGSADLDFQPVYTISYKPYVSSGEVVGSGYIIGSSSNFISTTYGTFSNSYSLTSKIFDEDVDENSWSYEEIDGFPEDGPFYEVRLSGEKLTKIKQNFGVGDDIELEFRETEGIGKISGWVYDFDEIIVPNTTRSVGKIKIKKTPPAVLAVARCTIGDTTITYPNFNLDNPGSAEYEAVAKCQDAGGTFTIINGFPNTPDNPINPGAETTFTTKVNLNKFKLTKPLDEGEVVFGNLREITTTTIFDTPNSVGETLLPIKETTHLYGAQTLTVGTISHQPFAINPYRGGVKEAWFVEIEDKIVNNGKKVILEDGTIIYYPIGDAPIINTGGNEERAIQDVQVGSISYDDETGLPIINQRVAISRLLQPSGPRQEIIIIILIAVIIYIIYKKCTD